MPFNQRLKIFVFLCKIKHLYHVYLLVFLFKDKFLGMPERKFGMNKTTADVLMCAIQGFIWKKTSLVKQYVSYFGPNYKMYYCCLNLEYVIFLFLTLRWVSKLLLHKQFVFIITYISTYVLHWLFLIVLMIYVNTLFPS